MKQDRTRRECNPGAWPQVASSRHPSAVASDTRGRLSTTEVKRTTPSRRGGAAKQATTCRDNLAAVGPSAQARDAAQWEEEEECADHNLRKVTIKRRRKGLRSSTKMDFMRLRNDFYLAWMNVYLSRSSKEIHMTSDVFSLSDTKHPQKNAVLC